MGQTLRRQLSNETPVNDASQYSLPDVRIPDLDLNFEELTRSISAARPATPRPPSRRTSLRLPNGISDRLSGLRQDRGMRNMRLGRRNRSPLRHGEDNTALLSRLLSVAAAATAATLLEGNEQAMSEARSMAQDGDDGTFDGFLQSLESGRLASALRGGGSGAEGNGDNTGSGHAPLNFFRMFRFGSPSNPASRSAPAMASPQQQQPTTGPQNMPRDNPSDGRMVPIIIVGIRAVTPGNGNGQEEAPMPPFLDALSALPTSPVGNDTGHEIGNIDSFLRPLRNGTRFSHRRRASMGGISNFPSGYDAQRHHRSPERIRPLSTTSEAASWPRPPPATPASPTLSNVTSRNSTPSQTRPASARSASASRRESIIRTTTTTTLETTTEVEDAPLRPRTARQRRLSESDYTRSTYNSRRNGIVEPDNAPTENTRSWIIYVLGGSYPENHPILTTPSLFTDSPTYEDMMLLSALLGPAKPPVASEQDVADAGGIYKIQSIRQEEGDSLLVAVAAHGDDRVELATEQRCLVCLCDFEQDDEARRLIKCGHLFHQECIDQVRVSRR
ncbi:hypothetical protein M8818_002894 [Zalaria obscura]|uniref:Uncharacterized protein n=1 Tax=Zalaria obscura TaxID=2024903 RepID=A0ACC3SHS7_9PEZI